MKMNKWHITCGVLVVVTSIVLTQMFLIPRLFSESSFPLSEDEISALESGKTVSKMSASRNIGTVQDLCLDSDFFAVCTVEEKLPAALTWMGDETGRIQLVTTDFRLRILQTSDEEKGAVGDILTMRMKGGETDTHVMYVSGSDPNRLAVGETYLFFFASEYENLLSDGTTDPDYVYRSAMSAEYTIFESVSDTMELAAINNNQTVISGEWRALAGPLTMDAADTVQFEDGSTVEIASLLSIESES